MEAHVGRSIDDDVHQVQTPAPDGRRKNLVQTGPVGWTVEVAAGQGCCVSEV